MPTHRFSPQDVVRLVSGGVHMTVEGVEQDSNRDVISVCCVWLDCHGVEHRANFLPHVLTQSGQEPKPLTFTEEVYELAT